MKPSLLATIAAIRARLAAPVAAQVRQEPTSERVDAGATLATVDDARAAREKIAALAAHKEAAE